MANVYYVDSLSGSDANAGTSPDAAFQTLSAVEALKLQPGDTVLMARGSTFNETFWINDSGLAGAPITFGAYGEGADPTIAGAGITGSKTNWITIQDIAITDSNGNAIYAGSASNWVIDNVTISDTGNGGTQGISFQFGSNVTVTNTVIEGVNSDGIWVDTVNGVTLENNHIGAVFGDNSDNIQVINSQHVVIHGNALDMTGTDSNKGNLVVNKCVDVTVSDNLMVGGGYGASINSNDVSITGNEIYGQGGYSWSFGIGIGEKSSVHDYVIADNFIHDVRFGIAVTGKGTDPVTRDNIEIYGNILEDNAGAAIKIDRPMTGSVHDNYVHAGTVPLKVASFIYEAGTVDIEAPQLYFGDTPDEAIDPDFITLAGFNGGGDVTPEEGAPLIVSVEGSDVPPEGLSLVGNYGTLTIHPDGTASYVMDPLETKGLKSDTFDIFDYVASDGTATEKGVIAVSIEPVKTPVAPVAGNDSLHIDYATEATGDINVLSNDYDLNGDSIFLRTIGKLSVGASEVTFAGKYGDFFVEKGGDVHYVVDPDKVEGLTGTVKESVFYKVSDGKLLDTASLTIAIDLDPPPSDPDPYGLA